MSRGAKRRRLNARRRLDERESDEKVQREAELQEHKAYTYQESCSNGSAIVRLSDLSYGDHSSRLIDGQENVARLKEILKIQGCLRLNRAFHVPVVTDAVEWECGKLWFERPAMEPNVSLPQLKMRPEHKLVALDHYSLISAARERFREIGKEDSWWVVDVYVTKSGKSSKRSRQIGGLVGGFLRKLIQRTDHPEDLRDDLTRNLRESYNKEKFPSDGRIYQEIRFYQSCRNKIAEDYWWAVLKSEPGSRKADYLRNLPEALTKAFDALLPIKGLWAGMSIGVLHKAATSYLGLIYRTFTHLMGGDLGLIERIDSGTIKILQSRAPSVSSNDLEFLQKKMDAEEGKLFPFIDNLQDRAAIWERLKDIDFLIPTLETFFQDILYLDVARVNMRQICLSVPEGEGTVDKVLRNQYINATTDDTVNNKIWDLWRFSLQYAFELSRQKDHHRRILRKKKDIERALACDVMEKPDEGTLANLKLHFIWLAWHHGFNVPSVDENPPRPVEIPLGLRPLPCDFPPDDGDDLGIERRCGKPFEDTVRADRYALSRESLQIGRVASRVNAGFVRQAVFRAFFAYLDPHTGETTAGSPAEQPLGHNGEGPEHPTFHSFRDNDNLVDPSPIQSMDTDFGHFPGFETIIQQWHTNAAPPSGTARVVEISHFLLETIVGEDRQEHWLPHNREALNTFFEKLDNDEFHIFPVENVGPAEDVGRTIFWLECYPYYIDNPSRVLRAQYCGGCHYHGLKSTADIFNATGRLRESIEELNRAQPIVFKRSQA